MIAAVQKAENYNRKRCLDDEYAALEMLKGIAGNDFDVYFKSEPVSIH